MQRAFFILVSSFSLECKGFAFIPVVVMVLVACKATPGSLFMGYHKRAVHAGILVAPRWWLAHVARIRSPAVAPVGL